MNGKIVGIGIGLLSVVFGIGLWYFTVVAHYEPIDVSQDGLEIEATLFDESRDALLVTELEGIDGNTSPLKFRACFTTAASIATLTETYRDYPGAEPLVAPGWFDCFDAKTIDQDIKSGAAFAFMGHENFTYGIDRVLAIYPDGRGYTWNQTNRCGDAVFNGDPAPEGCPPAPEGTQ